MKAKIILKLLNISILSLVLFFSSCEENESLDQVEDTTNQEKEIIEKYFLGERVKLTKEEDGTFSLQNTDIRLFENQLSDKKEVFNPNEAPDVNLTSKLGLARGIRKWANNTIVYTVQGLNQSVRNELQKSMDEWESKTNIRFKERTNESTYVTISSDNRSCNCGVATLGANGSRGFIRLGSNTTAFIIIHEIGHTLGYIHEQNRLDRDDHIIINYENIEDGAEDQFFKSTTATLVTKDFDIKSTMMYGSYTFSKNGRPTITDLNGNVLPRRQASISALDIQGTNSVYPSDNGGNPPPSNNPCDGVEDWERGKLYNVGDRVIYAEYLFERDFTRWNVIEKCN